MRRKKRQSIEGFRQHARPEGYPRWLQAFEANEGVPALLKQLSSRGVDVERVQTLLYAAPFFGSIISPRRDLNKLDADLAMVQRHLRDAANLLEPFPFEPQLHKWVLAMLGWVRTQVEERRGLFAQWKSAFTTVLGTDLIIALIAQDLERAGSRRVNEELATLLTAAAVPGGTRDKVANGWAWDATTVDKRRDRLKAKPLVALGLLGRLFDRVNIEKLAQRYPALFVKVNDKEKREPTTFGQKIAGLSAPSDTSAAQEAFQKASREAFLEPPGGDKKSPK